jgi:SAM-dependent methyltransferase
MDQRALYDRPAAQMARRDESPVLVARDRYVTDNIRCAVGADRPITIAELSVGDGRMTTAILSALPRARLTCVEISPARIKELAASLAADPALAPRVPAFVECNLDTEFDCLPGGSFDVVIALDIMEHVLDVFGFMGHCSRILKQGGRIYLRVPNIAYIRHRLGLLCGRLPVTASWFETPGELTAWRERHGWDGGHLHLFTISVLRQLCAESGFAVECCCDPGTRLAALRKVWPGLLFANPLIVACKA